MVRHEFSSLYYCIIVYYYRLNNNLLQLEQKHHISNRWLPTDELYKDTEFAVMKSKKEQILLNIWNFGQHRMFLLHLKKSMLVSVQTLLFGFYR